MNRRLAAAATLVALAAFAVPTPEARAQDAHIDSVDLQLAGSATVKGTIRGAQERENFLLDLPEGAVVKASVKRRGKGPFVPLLDMVDSGGVAVAGLTISTKGAGTTLATATTGVPASGTYKLRVFGDGTVDGDYTLKVTVKLKPKFRGEGVSVMDQILIVSQFAAPAGAQAQIKLRAASKTSGFVPALDELSGPDGFEVPLSGSKTAFIPLGSAGDYTVEFHDTGTGGPWICDVALRLPRVRKSSIDISAPRLTGNFVDDQPVYGRLVDDDEGGIVNPPDGGALDGAQISIPANSMQFPAVITMAEGAEFELPNGDSPAGPVIQFGPPGTTFTPAATVTLPYDGTIPKEDFRVYVREDDGSVLLVTPLDFSVDGSVSFPVAGFSSYVTGSAAPRTLDGQWAVVTLDGAAEGNFGGSAGASVTTMSFGGENSWVLSGGGVKHRWVRDDGQGNVVTEVLGSSDFNNGTYSEDGFFVFMQPQEGLQFNLIRGSRGHTMFLSQGENDHAELTFLLRRARGEPTNANLAGRWHAFFYSCGTESDSGGAGSPSLRIEAGRVTFNVALDGDVTITSVSGSEAQAPFPIGTWSSKPAKAPPRARLEPSRDMVNFFGDEDDDGPSVRLFPCLNGDVLVGAGASVSEDGPLLILVRESKGQHARNLDGKTTEFTFGAEAIDPKLSTDPPSVRFMAGTALSAHNGIRALVRQPRFPVFYGHESNGDPNVITPDITIAPQSSSYTLAANGAYRTTTNTIGAVSPGLDLILGFRVTEGTEFQLFAAAPNDDFTLLKR